MATKIGEHKSLLAHIAVAQNVEFHRTATDQIEYYASGVSGLTPAFSTYKTDCATLNAAFYDSNRAFETKELVKLDQRRDGTIEQIGNRIGYYYKFPLNESETEAAKALQFVVETYKKTSRIGMDYESETACARGLITELRKHPEHITLLEIVTLVERLEFTNNAFEALYTIRANSKEAKRERGSITELTKKANASFDVLCQVVSGMLHMSLDTVTKTNLTEIVNILNALIRQYSVIYSHHASVVSARKKDNGGADKESENVNPKSSED